MNAIKSYRVKENLTQMQLAEKVGYKFQADIYRAEKRLDAGRGLSPQQAQYLAGKLGIKRDHLLYPAEFEAAA